MKLLSLILLVAISGSGFADQDDNNRKKHLKQGVYVGGAVIGGIVGWRALRYLDYKMLEISIDWAEKKARRSRMPLSRFIKIDVTDPPIYRLIAPDGSQHHILGTMHISNISLSDFPTDSKLFPILEQANILMTETTGGRYTTILKWRYDEIRLNKQRSRLTVGATKKLSEQLGEKHWQKLTQIIAEKPDLKPFEQSLDEFMTEFDESTVRSAVDRLHQYGENYATPTQGLTMDLQLERYGRKHGKTVIGLETLKQIASASIEARSQFDYHIDVLKKLIDDGGIDYSADRIIDDIHRYASGKIGVPAKSTSNAYDEIILDRRNIAWVESGKIQKNCVHGNKCLIFVGLAHLDEGSNSLIKLLRKQGYQIERI